MDYRSKAVEAVEQNYYHKTTKLANVRLIENELTHNINNFNFIFALTVLKPILVQIRIVSHIHQVFLEP